TTEQKGQHRREHEHADEERIAAHASGAPIVVHARSSIQYKPRAHVILPHHEWTIAPTTIAGSIAEPRRPSWTGITAWSADQTLRLSSAPIRNEELLAAGPVRAVHEVATVRRPRGILVAAC